MPHTPPDFSKSLRIAMEMKNMAISEMATAIGATKSQISKWRRNGIPQKRLKPICDTLGMFFSEFAALGEEQVKPADTKGK